jgi:hypothetical protein
MPETSKSLLLGLLYVLEFVEFLTRPPVLFIGVWSVLYSLTEFVRS